MHPRNGIMYTCVSVDFAGFFCFDSPVSVLCMYNYTIWSYTCIHVHVHVHVRACVCC